MMMERHDLLNQLIGLPWVANAKGPDAYDCYHLTRFVEHSLFGVEMPDVVVPADPGWKWIIDQIARHPERQRWQEVSYDYKSGNVPRDGSIVALGSTTQAAHIGVWFEPERSILHTDNPEGVVFQDMQTVRMRGWQRQRFFERA